MYKITYSAYVSASLVNKLRAPRNVPVVKEWEIRITVGTDELDENGGGKHFDSFLEEFRNEIAHMNNYYLNALEYFEDKNPSLENIAKWIFDTAKEAVAKKGWDLKILNVYIKNDENYWVEYSENI